MALQFGLDVFMFELILICIGHEVIHFFVMAERLHLDLESGPASK